MSAQKTYDVAVIGAGVFGTWTAWHLARRGKRVLLIDAYGPANARASSAGETRIIRMGYGADELYTKWSQRSLAQWKKLFAAMGQPLFRETGVLWLAGKDDSRLRETAATLRRCEVALEEMDRAALEERYPQATKVRLVMDNLNTHRAASLYETFQPEEARRLARRLEIHYTPKHGSWLNVAEIELSALNSQCLNRRIPDIDLMRKEVAAWELDRNNRAATIDWRFTTEDARIKLKRIYPQL